MNDTLDWLKTHKWLVTVQSVPEDGSKVGIDYSTWTAEAATTEGALKMASAEADDMRLRMQIRDFLKVPR